MDAATLSEFVRSHVELEATVYTDGATVYEAILPEVYDHDSVQHSRNEWSRGNVHTNFGGVGVEPAQQPVAKVITAFDRPCIPADGVAIRAHTPGMHPNRALSGGRRNGLGLAGLSPRTVKRAMYGTWHHVSVKHLARYVNEVSFRLNDGRCEVDTLDRMESLFYRMGGRKLRYKDLVA